MKIQATVSGGYAGLTESYQVDTSENPTPGKRALEQALEKIGFFQAAAELQSELIGSDMMRWKINVLDGDRQHTVAFVEDGSEQIKAWQDLLMQIKALA